MKYNKKVVFSILAVVVVVGIGFGIWHLLSTVNGSNTTPVEATDNKDKKPSEQGKENESSKPVDTTTPSDVTTPSDKEPVTPVPTDDTQEVINYNEPTVDEENYPGLYIYPEDRDKTNSQDIREGADQTIIWMLNSEEGREQLLGDAEEASDEALAQIEEEYQAATANDSSFFYEGSEYTASSANGTVITLTTVPDAAGYGIVLKPHITCAIADAKVGYYVRCPQGCVQWDFEPMRNGKGKPYNSPDYAGYSDFFIAHRCFDNVIPVDAGAIRWYFIREMDDPIIEESTIFFRCFDMNSGMPLGVFTATVSFDKSKSTYRVTALENSNLLENPTLYDGTAVSEAKLDEMLELCAAAAEDFFLDAEYLANNPDWTATLRSNAVIARCPQKYQNQYVTREGGATSWIKHRSCVDVFSVTFTIPNFTTVTYFVTPTHQYEGSSKPAYNNSCELTVAGREPYYLWSRETMIVPRDWDTVSD